jgi:hypothetical protein
MLCNGPRWRAASCTLINTFYSPVWSCKHTLRWAPSIACGFPTLQRKLRSRFLTWYPLPTGEKPPLTYTLLGEEQWLEIVWKHWRIFFPDYKSQILPFHTVCLLCICCISEIFPIRYMYMLWHPALKPSKVKQRNVSCITYFNPIGKGLEGHTPNWESGRQWRVTFALLHYWLDYLKNVC